MSGYNITTYLKVHFKNTESYNDLLIEYNNVTKYIEDSDIDSDSENELMIASRMATLYTTLSRLKYGRGPRLLYTSHDNMRWLSRKFRAKYHTVVKEYFEYNKKEYESRSGCVFPCDEEHAFDNVATIHKVIEISTIE